MQTLLGQYLGRYHILEQLGEGGMATVFKAYDTRLERLVAIKVIRKDVFAPGILETVLRRFEREAKALARLSHPNIIKIYDFGEYEGAPYLVMEYIPGGTLKQRTGSPMSWRDAARMLLPVTRALSYAHGENIVHRDVKPANILITESGEPMLGDFGIAKILESTEGSTLTGTGVGIGTPEYMAPEQGLGKEVDPRTDVYALGVVLYELITGRKPYIADTPLAVVLKHVTDPLPSPKAFVPGLPDRVEWLLAKVLAKEPGDRFQDMGAFTAALERLIQEIPVLPAQATVTEKLALPLRRGGGKRWFWAALGGIILVLGIGTVAVGFLLFRAIQGSTRSTAAASSVAAILPLGTPQEVVATQTQPPATVIVPSPTSTMVEVPTVEQIIPTNPSLVVGSTQTFPVDGSMAVYVPAGEFLMGTSPGDPEAGGDERPQHRVYLDAFWIDQTEVTNTSYAQCVVAGACPTPLSPNSYSKQAYYNDPAYSDYPVIWVTWNGAKAYCTWAGRRLPTEAEWEKAARGTDGRIYPWGNDFDGTRVNYCDRSCPKDYKDTGFMDGYELTSPVSAFPNDVSPYGALDMAGNVSEWVADFYAIAYYAVSPSANPLGPDVSNGYYVVRGGNWYGQRSSVRTTRRGYSESDGPGTVTGLRCALSAGK